ncbi:MAG: four helix bundle suffix domain-containing protein [Muribaculaceae bacterium]|nr:four helix bundle suffix domain-containing protein [Muribaculaceae bacterium]
MIRQTQYLLDKLLESQQRRFLESGGIREAMSRARREYRSNHSK